MRLAWRVVVFIARCGLCRRGLHEARQRVLQCSLFGQRDEKGQGGFGTLILAQPIHMQAVATAPGAGIVERKSQIISSEKPLERATRFRDPERVVRGVIGLDAGGYRRLRLDGLLVELRTFLAAPIKSIRPDGPEGAG